MSRKTRRRTQQPDQTRRGFSTPPGTLAVSLTSPTAVGRPPIPGGSDYFQGQYAGFNNQGTNSMPVSAYSDPRTRPQEGTAFPPGDPIRPTPGLDNGNLQAPGPRQWSYPVGVNISTVPRQTESTAFETLRNLAALYEGIGLCEAAIMRILERLSLTVTPKAEYLSDAEDASSAKWREPGLRMAEWFNEGPDKQLNSDLTGWMIAVMRDVLEVDAVGIWHQPTRDGSLHSLQYVAGDTLVCLLDEAGRTPRPPAPAYRQVLYGAPGVLLTCEEIDYLRVTERTESPYGISPVERILLRINQALRKENYDLTRYTAGATPEGVLQTAQPELFKMTVDDVLAWEQMWNGALSGNDTLRVRTKAVPPGWTFTSTEQRDIATAFDEYLLNVTVAAFGLTKDEIGFTDTSNRSTGQTQESAMYRNAVRPRTDFFARYFSKVIRRYDGKPLYPKNPTVSRPGAGTKGKGVWDARYAVGWKGIEEPADFARNASSYSVLVSNGIVSPTQAKKLLGIPLEPDEPYIPAYRAIPGGTQSIVILEDMVKQRDQMHDAQVASLQAQKASAEQTKKAMEQGINGPGMAGNVAQVMQQQVAHNASAIGQGQQAIAPKAQNPGSQAAASAKQANQSQKPQQPPQQRAERENDHARGVELEPRRAARPRGGDDDVGGWALGADGPLDALGNTLHRDRDAGALVKDTSGDTAITAASGVSVGAADHESGLSLGGGGLYAADDVRARRDQADREAAAGRGIYGDDELRRDDGAGLRHALGDDRQDGASGGRGAGDGTGISAIHTSAAEHRRVAGEHRAAAGAGTPSQTRGGGGDGGTGAPDAVGARSDEWAAWRERALKDVRRSGKVTRAFTPRLIEPALHGWVSIELTRAATAEEVRAVFRAAREREEGAEGAPVAMTEAPVIVSAAVAAGATETDPATRALDALLARLEQVATARAEAQAQAQTEAGLRELRTRVLEGITL